MIITKQDALTKKRTDYLKEEFHLGEYGPQLFDSWSGKPVMWGYEITQRLGEEKFAKLRFEVGIYGFSLECSYPTWFVITKKLTREEAIKEYGEVTNEEYGPKGGWKSVTLGTTKFGTKLLRPY